jgi:hypothetical protein
VSEGTPSKQAFLRFISAYSGQKDFLESVSIGDLHYELAYHRWLLEGTIPAPSRLHRFSRVDDPIIHLLDRAGLPLTVDASAGLLDTLTRTLKREFRAVPHRRATKPRVVALPQVRSSLVAGVEKSRQKQAAPNLADALAPLLEWKKVGTILYEKFRCGAIHGAAVKVDSAHFFTEADAYWQALHSDYYGAFELIEFSAPYLLSLLERCITTYQHYLNSKVKVPPDIHFFMFPDDSLSQLQFLDQALLPEGGRVTFRTGGR